jgi:hypothetical protein
MSQHIIDTFARDIDPRMSIAGIRRRGAVSGVPFPAEDLDAYIKHLISTSSNTTGINTRYSFADFTTIPGVDVPMATDYGGVGAFFIWVTSAGVVKRLWLSKVASDGATGVTGVTRIVSLPNQRYLMFGPATPQLTADQGASVAAFGVLNAANVNDVTYHELSDRFVLHNTSGNVFRTYPNAYPNLSGGGTAISGTFSGTVRMVETPIPDYVFAYKLDATSALAAARVPVNSGSTSYLNFNGTKVPNSGLIACNGYMIGKFTLGGLAYYRRYPMAVANLTDLEAAAPPIYPEFTPSTTSIPFAVGNLFFDVDASVGDLWYSRDMTNWFFHSKASDSDELRTAVGSRLFTSSAIASNLYFSGPAI